MTRGQRHPEGAIFPFILIAGKILFIGGGIANFTNVASTFKGIIRALKEFQRLLKAHNVSIYVRRAGPNYQEGLRLIRDTAAVLELDMQVFGPGMLCFFLTRRNVCHWNCASGTQGRQKGNL